MFFYVFTMSKKNLFAKEGPWPNGPLNTPLIETVFLQGCNINTGYSVLHLTANRDCRLIVGCGWP